MVDGGREGGDYRIPKNSEERNSGDERKRIGGGRCSFELLEKHGEWRWRLPGGFVHPGGRGGTSGLARARWAPWWGSGGERGAEFEEVKAGRGEASRLGRVDSQLGCASVTISSSAGRAGARPHRNFRERDARSAAMLSALDLTGSRARLRAGALPATSWSTQHRRCRSAPCHLIPRRVLPPARLVQKRKQVTFFVSRIAVGERGTAVAPTFHQSLVLRD